MSQGSTTPNIPTSVAFSAITGLPNSLAGYGITTGIGLTTFKRKPSNETRTSNTTLAADADLVFAVDINQTWLVRYMLFYQGTTTADVKFNLTVPTGASYLVGGNGQDVANTTVGPYLNLATSSLGADIRMGTIGATTGLFSTIEGFIKTDASHSGNVSLIWAQVNTDTTPVTLFANSYLTALRVA